jgi:5-methylcytosine-specific restriction endonuclease McrA
MDLIMKSIQIVERLQYLHKQEKEILSETIKLLGEIRKYKIFSDYQCKDLLEFCQKILGYTESQSHRRIRALNLIDRYEELDPSMPLTHIMNAGNLFDKCGPSISKEEKIEIIGEIKNKPTQEAKELLKAKGREIQGKDPLPKKDFQTKIRKQDNKVIVTFELTEEEYELVDSLRKKNENLKDVFIDSIKLNKELMDRKKHAQVKNPRKQKTLKNKRTIPADVKRAAFQRSNGRCSNCNTMKNLEYDHKIPFALGGKSDKDNIRLLCKNCNLRAGIIVFGLEKMKLNNRAERFKKSQSDHKFISINQNVFYDQ